MVGNLASDLGSLVTLKIDLLKAEVREGARDVAKDSVLLIASAVCAVFALLGITAALSIALGGILPLAAPYNYACGAFLVAAIYAGAGTILFFMGKERVKTSRIKPKQTIDDFQRDKQWLTTHQ